MTNSSHYWDIIYRSKNGKLLHQGCCSKLWFFFMVNKQQRYVNRRDEVGKLNINYQ